MKLLGYLRLICILLGIVGVSMLLPLGVALYYGEQGAASAFAASAVGSMIVALLVLVLFRHVPVKFSIRGSFLFVALAWTSASVFGAVPLYTGGFIPHAADAVFESISGFTTTGATILSDMESLPRSINLWRCQMHWLGGMGIVALTVALFPLLGVGGFQLIKAETTGPEKGKITPKITNTAKVLWLIYLAFTAVQFVVLYAAGMDVIDALSHAFATLGTGGFSTRNSSIAAYQSGLIDAVCTVFMLIAAVNFNIYFYAFTRKFEDIWNNSELRCFIAVVVVSIVIVSVSIWGMYGVQAVRYASFQVASIISTTGFGTSDYTTWPPVAQFVMFTLFFLGGCSGSTAGGIKIIRWVILGKQVSNEVRRTLHPHGVFSIRLNGRAGRKDVVFTVAAFVMVYLCFIFVTTFVGTCGGLDILSAFTGALSMVGNVGPAFGQLGPSFNYGFLPDFIKWWYGFAMLAGRLELYTMIIMFTTSFWKE